VRAARRNAAVVALVLLAVAIAIWFARGGAERTSRSEPPIVRTDDEAARRLRAIQRVSASLAPALARHQLRGRVVDAAGTPVPGAVVALGAPPMQTRSSDRGEFVLRDLVAGRYSVEARKGALVAGPLAVQLSGDREVTLVMRRGAELRVEVVSATDQKPIANADVRISLLSMYDKGGVQTDRTDDTGVATFEGVTLVAHTIWVTADGFAELEDTVDPMHAAGTSLRFRVELVPGISVRGRVVDADSGRPIADAAIESFKGDHREGARRGDDRARHGNAPPYAMEVRGIGVRSDAEGRFRIGVAKGPWTIVASHPSYATIGTFIAVTDSPLEVQISMTRGEVLRGVVVDARDTPVPAAEIEARWQFGGRIERTTRADGRGRFELVGLPAAPLEILARADAGTSAPMRIDLADRKSDADVLLVLDNTGAITGRVMRGGKPVAYGQVFYVEQHPRAKVHPAVVNTDETGAFRITGVALDRVYTLNAMPHQDGDAWLRTGHVEAKAGADVTIEIPADGSIRGRVELAAGKLADVRVELEGNTPPRALDRAGKFAFDDVPPGKRTLLFTGPKIAERRIDVELAAGQTLDVGTVSLAPGRLVAGKVVDAHDAPVLEADLVVTAEGHSPLAAHTGRDGAFSLLAPAGTDLVLEARGPRGGVARVELPARAASSDLVLRFAGSATLEGSITLGDDPAANVVVELRRTGNRADRPDAVTQADPAGYFRIIALEPGSYDLTITRTDPDAAQPIEYARALEIKAGANYANTDLKQLAPR
jgi:hypothetical protein